MKFILMANINIIDKMFDQTLQLSVVLQILGDGKKWKLRGNWYYNRGTVVFLYRCEMICFIPRMPAFYPFCQPCFVTQIGLCILQLCTLASFSFLFSSLLFTAWWPSDSKSTLNDKIPYHSKLGYVIVKLTQLSMKHLEFQDIISN